MLHHPAPRRTSMAQLENWILMKNYRTQQGGLILCGEVTGHPTGNSGRVHTSRVMELDLDEGYAITKTGTMYTLGDPAEPSAENTPWPLAIRNAQIALATPAPTLPEYDLTEADYLAARVIKEGDGFKMGNGSNADDILAWGEEKLAQISFLKRHLRAALRIPEPTPCTRCGTTLDGIACPKCDFEGPKTFSVDEFKIHVSTGLFTDEDGSAVTDAGLRIS